MSETSPLSSSPSSLSSPRRQLLLVAAVVCALSLILVLIYLGVRPRYVVMFRDLKTQDAATIVAELERQKAPYQLADGGQTILVPEKDVHAMRLRVMSSDLPLKGTTGFELFNSSDLGFTEFAQKVNYQRALQGELARTIMTLEGVEAARVHLTIPESSLFNREQSKPKASVTIATRDDQVLAVESSRGIQRLVASAVPAMEAADVTILDQHGAPMIRPSANVAALSDDPQLQLKMELEAYYAHKLVAALEPIVGHNRVQVSVDAAVNFDQVRITEESSDARGASAPVRDEEKTKPEAQPALALDGENDRQLTGGKAPLAGAGVATDRQHNARRLEQIVSAPGSIRRLTVGLLLQAPIDAPTQLRISELATATVGASASRGDVVSVFVQSHPPEPATAPNVPRVPNTSLLGDAQVSATAPAIDQRGSAAKEDSADATTPSTLAYQVVAALTTVLAMVCAGWAYWMTQRRRQPLTANERAAFVQRIKQLMAEEERGAARVS